MSEAKSGSPAKKPEKSGMGGRGGRGSAGTRKTVRKRKPRKAVDAINSVETAGLGVDAADSCAPGAAAAGPAVDDLPDPNENAGAGDEFAQSEALDAAASHEPQAAAAQGAGESEGVLRDPIENAGEARALDAAEETGRDEKDGEDKEDDKADKDDKTDAADVSDQANQDDGADKPLDPAAAGVAPAVEAEDDIVVVEPQTVSGRSREIEEAAKRRAEKENAPDIETLAALRPAGFYTKVYTMGRDGIPRMHLEERRFSSARERLTSLVPLGTCFDVLYGLIKEGRDLPLWEEAAERSAVSVSEVRERFALFYEDLMHVMLKEEAPAGAFAGSAAALGAQEAGGVQVKAEEKAKEKAEEEAGAEDGVCLEQTPSEGEQGNQEEKENEGKESTEKKEKENEKEREQGKKSSSLSPNPLLAALAERDGVPFAEILQQAAGRTSEEALMERLAALKARFAGPPAAAEVEAAGGAKPQEKMQEQARKEAKEKTKEEPPRLAPEEAGTSDAVSDAAPKHDADKVAHGNAHASAHEGANTNTDAHVSTHVDAHADANVDANGKPHGAAHGDAHVTAHADTNANTHANKNADANACSEAVFDEGNRSAALYERMQESADASMAAASAFVCEKSASLRDRASRWAKAWCMAGAACAVIPAKWLCACFKEPVESAGRAAGKAPFLCRRACGVFLRVLNSFDLGELLIAVPLFLFWCLKLLVRFIEEALYGAGCLSVVLVRCTGRAAASLLASAGRLCCRAAAVWIVGVLCLELASFAGLAPASWNLLARESRVAEVKTPQPEVLDALGFMSSTGVGRTAAGAHAGESAQEALGRMNEEPGWVMRTFVQPVAGFFQWAFELLGDFAAGVFSFAADWLGADSKESDRGAAMLFDELVWPDSLKGRMQALMETVEETLGQLEHTQGDGEGDGKGNKAQDIDSAGSSQGNESGMDKGDAP